MKVATGVLQLPDLRWPFSGILIVRPGQLKCLSVHPFEKNKVSPVGTDPVSQNLGTGKLVFGLDARYSTVVMSVLDPCQAVLQDYIGLIHQAASRPAP